jgi:hypothetical protein
VSTLTLPVQSISELKPGYQPHSSSIGAILAAKQGENVTAHSYGQVLLFKVERANRELRRRRKEKGA